MADEHDAAGSEGSVAIGARENREIVGPCERVLAGRDLRPRQRAATRGTAEREECDEQREDDAALHRS